MLSVKKEELSDLEDNDHNMLGNGNEFDKDITNNNSNNKKNFHKSDSTKKEINNLSNSQSPDTKNKKKNSESGGKIEKLLSKRAKKESVKMTTNVNNTNNNNNPSDLTKQEFNQKFFNVITKIIKFFEENDVIDTKVKKKNPMTVLNKLKNVTDPSQRNDLLEKLENISNNIIKVNKETSGIHY